MRKTLILLLIQRLLFGANDNILCSGTQRPEVSISVHKNGRCRLIQHVLDKTVQTIADGISESIKDDIVFEVESIPTYEGGPFIISMKRPGLDKFKLSKIDTICSGSKLNVRSLINSLFLEFDKITISKKDTKELVLNINKPGVRLMTLPGPVNHKRLEEIKSKYTEEELNSPELKLVNDLLQTNAPAAIALSFDLDPNSNKEQIAKFAKDRNALGLLIKNIYLTIGGKPVIREHILSNLGFNDRQQRIMDQYVHKTDAEIRTLKKEERTEAKLNEIYQKHQTKEFLALMQNVNNNPQKVKKALELTYDQFTGGSKKDFNLIETMQTAFATGLLNKQLAHHLAPVLENAISDNIDKAIQKLPLIHYDIETTLPQFNLQEEADLQKHKKALAEVKESLNKNPDYYHNNAISGILRALENAETPEAILLLDEIYELVESKLNSFSSQLKGAPHSRKLQKKVSDYNKLKKRAIKSIKRAQRKVDQIENKRKVKLSVQKFEDIGEKINLVLSACEKNCLTAINEAPLTPIQEIDKEYDIAAKVNISTINNYLKQMWSDGKFNFCETNRSKKSCLNSGPFTKRDRVIFESSPQISWNEENQAYRISIPNIAREQDFLQVPGWLVGNRDSTYLHADVVPTVSENGKKVVLKTKDGGVELGANLDRTSILGKAWLAVLNVPGAAITEIIHYSGQNVILATNKETAANAIETPLDISGNNSPLDSIVEIASEGEEISIYAKLKE